MVQTKLTPREAIKMLDVYESYLKDCLTDIFTPSVQDTGLIEKVTVVGENLWGNANTKSQKCFENRLKFINGVYEDYQMFRQALLDTGASPFKYKDKSMELLSRN